MERLAKPKEAVLKLNRVYFDEIEYRFHAKDDCVCEYNFNFEKALENIKENQYRLFLKCNAINEKNDIELHIEVVGEFECELEDETLRSSLLNQNAVAILFPYLRSQICLVTTQPQSIPINLPAININSLFEK